MDEAAEMEKDEKKKREKEVKGEKTRIRETREHLNS